MLPDPEVEERFKEAQGVLAYVSKPVARIGVWPVDVTVYTSIKLLIYYIYHGTRTLLELVELVMVFGSLQTVVDNFMLTGTQITVILRVTALRFHPLAYRVITELNRLKEDNNFENSEEKKIFIEYSESSKRFHDKMLWPVVLCTFSWYVTPLMNHIGGLMSNETVPLVAPWRLPPFVDMSRLDVAIAVYIFELPMLYSGCAYLTTYSIHFSFINDICAQVIILSERMKDLKGNRTTNMHETLGPLIERHVMIIETAKQLDDYSSFHLLIELGNTTLLVGLCSYNIMVNIGVLEKMVIFNYVVYMFIILCLVYINCHMGQCLEDTATYLSMALRECNWDHLPPSFRNARILCMLQAQSPLQMTAGHFYNYSLRSFTSILKTSMAYVSMLKTMV